MSDWSTPRDDITGLDIAFPARAVADFMPAMDEIPDEFKNGYTKWNDLQNDWFFFGLKNTKWQPKDGIDSGQAVAHLKVIQGSYEPQHEHKEAAVAYLASLWFDDVTYEKAKARS